jgi:hypothetical protein
MMKKVSREALDMNLLIEAKTGIRTQYVDQDINKK